MSSDTLPAAAIDELVARLDLETKVRLLSGAGAWTTHAVPEIGLRAVTVSDGPIGVRGGSENDWDASAALPSGSAMAASWDEDLLHRVGEALAAEAVRKGVDVVLGPTINLHRSPLGGRHFECFSEDPLLTGRLAAAYVRGVQGQGVGACPKHYVANDAETERMSVDNRVDERTLRELYLDPFEQVVEDASPWMVMAAYNAVNGPPMTENDLLERPLRSEWGFDGVVVSDWGAVYDGEPSARAGLDLAMPGPEPRWGEPLLEAVRAGRVPDEAIDVKVRHLLLLAARAGALDGFAAAAERPVPGDVHDAAPIAREAAVAATVLLTNDGTLPLAPGLRRVAVLGPGARDPRPLGGGSAIVFPPYLVTPYAGLRAALGDDVEVVTAAGTALADGLRPVRADELAALPAGSAVTVRWLAADGTVVCEQPSATTTLVRITAEVPAGAVALELTCRFVADEEGEWRLGVSGVGGHHLELDGVEVLDERWTAAGDDLHSIFAAPPQQGVPVRLAQGQVVAVRQRFTWAPDGHVFLAGVAVQAPTGTVDDEIRRAVDLARTSDVAVVVVGTSEAQESEGSDRTTLALSGRQDELVRAVAAVNPRTVVVVNAGAPVEMPWRDEVAAVLVVWFNGMELGTALADVLLGTAEPGGRLPTTWPATTADAPVLVTTPVHGRLEYAEGLDIGHRAYLAAGTEPAFWFGHGLGYTSWSVDAVDVPPEVTGDGFDVLVRLRNDGPRAGQQVVQVYASRPAAAVGFPVRRLAGFVVVRAAAGETVEAVVHIGRRVLRHWDAEVGAWAVEPGELVLHVGRSAGALDASTTTALRVATTA